MLKSMTVRLVPRKKSILGLDLGKSLDPLQTSLSPTAKSGKGGAFVVNSLRRARGMIQVKCLADSEIQLEWP